MFLRKKALKPYEKNLKNSKTTLKIHYTFIYCLKMKNFIAGPCLPVNFVRLRLGFDVPEQIAPLRGWGHQAEIWLRFKDKLRTILASD